MEQRIDAPFSPHVDHDKLNYLHAYISFSYRDRTPYLSVYLQSFETGDWAVGKPIYLPNKTFIGSLIMDVILTIHQQTYPNQRSSVRMRPVNPHLYLQICQRQGYIIPVSTDEQLGTYFRAVTR